MAIRALRSHPASQTVRPRNQIEIGVLIKQYKDADEAKWETNFVRGQLLDAMIKLGANLNHLSRELGSSISHIRSLITVYQAFPKDRDRDQRLSWTHHQLALKTKNPTQTLRMAAENGLSIDKLTNKLRSEKPLKLTKEKKKMMRYHFSRLIHSIAEKGEHTPFPNWKDTFAVYVWWTNAVKKLSLMELFCTVIQFEADEHDSQLAREMVKVLRDEFESRRVDSKFYQPTDYSYLFDGQ
jgi:hypothetical protein